MAFYGASSAPFAAAAYAPQYDAAGFGASQNLYMANADPDYYINPLDDENNAYENQNNISLACNPSLNQSCVWQGFVEGNEEGYPSVVAAPSEYESRVRCGTIKSGAARAAAAFACDSKSCFKRSKSNKCSFTPAEPTRTPTPLPTKCSFMSSSNGRSMSSSIIGGGTSIIGGGSHFLGCQQQQHLLCN